MSEWNSLEIAKLSVAALIPAVGIVVAFLIAKYTKELESKRWRNEKLIEFRIEFYCQVGPLLNRLFCFCALKNDWTSNSVQDIISLKRQLDRQFFTFGVLLGDEVLERYRTFIDCIYRTHIRHAADPVILRPLAAYEGKLKNWSEEDSSRFDPKCTIESDAQIRQQVTECYEVLIEAMAKAIRLGETTVPRMSVRPVTIETPREPAGGQPFS